MKHAISLISLILALCLGFTASAQSPSAPVDGDMVALQADKLWKLSYLANAPIKEVTKIADDMQYPSISPDGTKVLMFQNGGFQKPHKLLQWSDENPVAEELFSDIEVSGYVTWQTDDDFTMREHSAPFTRAGADRHYSLAKKAPQLKLRRLHKESRLLAYDADDVIILENADNQTLQAISDVRTDRYFGPVVSPDGRFVAFTGLSTGVHVFDVAANAVVFIGSHGTAPAFSPDGRFLVYANTRDNGHEITSGELVLVDLDAHAYRYIANPNHEIRLRATLSQGAAFVSYQTDNNSIFRAKLAP